METKGGYGYAPPLALAPHIYINPLTTGVPHMLYQGSRSDAAAGHGRRAGRVRPAPCADFLATRNLIFLALKYTGVNGLIHKEKTPVCFIRCRLQ